MDFITMLVIVMAADTDTCRLRKQDFLKDFIRMQETLSVYFGASDSKWGGGLDGV